MSTPPFVVLPAVARRLRLTTPRGALAAVEARPEGTVRGTALLVPGFTGSKEDFIAVLEPLCAAGWRVVALDMRGQHESPHAVDPAAYDLDVLAQDIVAVGDALRAESDPVHLVGHSLGGLVARAAVLASPSTWASLTLLCSGPGALSGPTGDRTRLLLDALPVLDPETIWGAMRALDAEAGTPAPPAEILAFLQARWLRSCPSGVYRMGRQLLSCPDRTDDLRATGVPTLVAFGDLDDAWSPAVQADMAERLGAEVVRFAGVGHSPAAESPEETAAALDTWWAPAG